ncbi:MAG: fatty acid desaturase [Verrucomicrobiota bacterium]
MLALTGGTALFAAGRWPWPVVVGLVFLHGMVSSFYINGIHELGHGTVFRTKWLNRFFDRVLSFFSWTNCDLFEVSHVRHHQYTLHPPDDLEAVLPIKILTDAATLVFPAERARGATPYPNDEMILESAIAGEVDVIVSGDKKHLLPLRKFQGILILSPADFLRTLPAAS